MPKKKKKSKSEESLDEKLNARKKKKVAPKVIKKAAPKVKKQKRYHCTGKKCKSHSRTLKTHWNHVSLKGCGSGRETCIGKDCPKCLRSEEGNSIPVSYLTIFVTFLTIFVTFLTIFVTFLTI